jgi:UDP-N-acetylmuramate: L-alanyl-gamma-D-glutamyl-meso-diaminopimelate ligase
MNVHFIAIGGSAMHNLAIALHKKGFRVSGSDDEIFEPSRSRLDKYNLLPDSWGWFPEKITDNLDAIILGMHARSDNPELLEAQDKGLRIYSYPEYIYEQTRDKKRIVIGGSHGKTTTTAMLMHVLGDCKMDFDYMVGANLDGFDTMVKLTKEAPIVVLEGDEYLSSPIDLRPKFHLYHPNIAVITGIAWDHINVFPTFDNYVEQFKIYADKIEPGGSLIYFSGDQNILKIAMNIRRDIDKHSYHTHQYSIENDKLYLLDEGNKYPLHIFGEHNLQNLNAALMVSVQLGISKEVFYKSMQSFTGAAKRLQLLTETSSSIAYLDFAHSPSKLKATVEAVKSRFSSRKLVACMELHTFSSLKEEFLPQYKGCMDKADIAIVYFNPEVVEHKKLSKINVEQVAQAFHKEGLIVFTDSLKMLEYLEKQDYNNSSLLLMSSGNFNGLDLKAIAGYLLNN